MDAKHWNGDYDRDHESVEDEPCLSCGAGPNEPCEPFCGCDSCRKVRERLRREAEIDVDLIEPSLLDALKLKGMWP